jgi:hypothetical protein
MSEDRVRFQPAHSDRCGDFLAGMCGRGAHCASFHDCDHPTLWGKRGRDARVELERRVRTRYWPLTLANPSPFLADYTSVFRYLLGTKGIGAGIVHRTRLIHEHPQGLLVEVELKSMRPCSILAHRVVGAVAKASADGHSVQVETSRGQVKVRDSSEYCTVFNWWQCMSTEAVWKTLQDGFLHASGAPPGVDSFQDESMCYQRGNDVSWIIFFEATAMVVSTGSAFRLSLTPEVGLSIGPIATDLSQPLCRHHEDSCQVLKLRVTMDMFEALLTASWGPEAPVAAPVVRSKTDPCSDMAWIIL